MKYCRHHKWSNSRAGVYVCLILYPLKYTRISVGKINIFSLNIPSSDSCLLLKINNNLSVFFVAPFRMDLLFAKIGRFQHKWHELFTKPCLVFLRNKSFPVNYWYMPFFHWRDWFEFRILSRIFFRLWIKSQTQIIFF